MMNVIYKKDTSTQTNTETCILKILAYFSLFRYPLPKGEIIRFMPPGTRIDTVDDALELLINDGIVYRFADFYSLQNEPAWVKRRREGNLRASHLMPVALRIGRFLSKFPFVKGVAISGSLSKMYADEKTDIDFFIITDTDRLWVARTLMHLFKKITYLTGRQDYYCMNYYIDESALKIDDQNIYTAMETMTLIPAGGQAIQDFFAANEWVGEWFASYEYQHVTKRFGNKRTGIQKLSAWLIGGYFGNWIDNRLMKLTTKRWQRKKRAGMRTADGKEMDLVTDKHFAKSNPGMFRERILSVYDEVIAELKRRAPQYF